MSSFLINVDFQIFKARSASFVFFFQIFELIGSRH